MPNTGLTMVELVNYESVSSLFNDCFDFKIIAQNAYARFL